MSDLILHHYWGSPYAEKIRLLLGYKQLAWRSLEIPAIPPRDSLRPVFGAFRRTPVLQLGADFFCDTRLIAEVIDAISPDRPLNRGHNRALSAVICGWVEPRAFVMTGPVRFQSARDVEGVFDGTVAAAAFQQDRLPFMLPAVDARRFPEIKASAEDHLRTYLDVIADALGETHPFIGGTAPTFADFSAYHLVWWLRHPPAHAELLSGAPAITAWADCMAAFGHGRYDRVDVQEALGFVQAAHKQASWKAPWKARPDSRLGNQVAVMPDDYGQDGVRGTLVISTDRHIAVQYDAPTFGTVRVHFPRLGYEVIAA